jgi:hypothetical protein
MPFRFNGVSIEHNDAASLVETGSKNLDKSPPRSTSRQTAGLKSAFGGKGR